MTDKKIIAVLGATGAQGGGLVRLDNVVRLVPTQTASRIDRLDRQRQVSLRAAVAPFREALALKYLHNASCAEMAELLGMSPTAVRTRLFRARKLLRQRTESLEKAGEETTHGMP